MVLPRELPGIMRKHTYTGAMGNIWIMLVSGIFFIYFGNGIGMSKFQWGLLSGIAAWMIALQPLSAAITQSIGRRKILWFSFAMIERSSRLVGILLALWLWQIGWSYAAAVVLIVAVSLSNFFGAMAGPPWLSWLADIIPEDKHGAFWGQRAAWISLSVIGALAVAGFVIDRSPADSKIYVVVGVFAIATVIGLLDILIHGTIPEPVPTLPDRKHFLHRIQEPIRDHAFRPWLIFITCWTFSMSLGGSLAALYFLNELGISNNLLGGTLVLTCLTMLGSMLTGSWSGRMVDRLGIRKVLIGGHMAWGLLPFFWLMATPATALIWLSISSMIGGVGCTAADTAATKLITRYPPADLRAMYIAVSRSLASMAGGLGAIVAGTLLYFTGDWSLSMGRLPDISGFHILFVTSMLLRFSSLGYLVLRVKA